MLVSRRASRAWEEPHCPARTRISASSLLTKPKSGARSSALRILSRRDAPALSLGGLDAESLRDRGELVAHLLNAGGELVRATQIDDLAGDSQPGWNGRMRMTFLADVAGNACSDRDPHSARR